MGMYSGGGRGAVPHPNVSIKLKLKTKFVPKVLQWPKVFHTLCIRKERTAVQEETGAEWETGVRETQLNAPS